MKSTIRKVSVLLQALARTGRPATLSELSSALGLPKPTARRLLVQLMDEGLVDQNPDDRTYKLGMQLITLASAVLEGVEVRKLGTDILYGVMEDTGESAYLAVLDRGHSVYVDSVECDRSIRVLTKVGSRRPAELTASGRVLLAYASEDERQLHFVDALRVDGRPSSVNPVRLERLMTEVRASGFAASTDEAEAGTTGVAAPVFAGGKCVAALAIGMPTFRYVAGPPEVIHTKVIAGAERLTQRLSTREAPDPVKFDWNNAT